MRNGSTSKNVCKKGWLAGKEVVVPGWKIGTHKFSFNQHGIVYDIILSTT
jgi:hypothetical protein